MGVRDWRRTVRRSTAALQHGYHRARQRYVASRMVRWGVVGGVLVGLAAVSALAQSAPPRLVLDGMADSYRTASHTWLAQLLPIAQRTFALLATLELIVSGMLWMFQRESLDDIAGRFLVKFIVLSFMLTLITGFHTWVPTILSGFAAAGERATGISGLSPSTVLSVGWSASATLLHSISVKNAVLNPVTSMFVVFLAFTIWLAFVVIAAQLLRVLIESYLIVSGGVLFLGFAGFRATAAYAENYINYAVAVAIKVFVLYLLVGVGMSLATQWSAMLQTADWNIGGDTPTILPQIVGGIIILAVLTVSLPGSFAHRITGSHSLGVANALRSL